MVGGHGSDGALCDALGAREKSPSAARQARRAGGVVCSRPAAHRPTSAPVPLPRLGRGYAALLPPPPSPVPTLLVLHHIKETKSVLEEIQ